MKVLCIFGTRPEAIKMAPVIKQLQKHSHQIQTVVCVTAQHREMLDQVLGLFSIKPDYDLSVMQPDQTLTTLTSTALSRIDEVISKEKPDWVLVQGDTTTTMTASLAAFYHRIKVGHVEAGLRSGDIHQPFPEEVNRRITSIVGSLHFAPTETSRGNLLREGIDDKSIFVTGNTVIDALLEIAEREYAWESGPLTAIPRDKRLILVTTHRRENFGEPLNDICAALKEIAVRFSDVQIVFPVHLNPRVRQTVFALLDQIENISLLDPLDYLPLVQLLKQATLVITDSGGLQEEAPGLGKPVLVLREVTERPEGVVAGTVKLIGTNKERIVAEAAQLLNNSEHYLKMSRAVNPYGDGNASERIVRCLLNSE